MSDIDDQLLPLMGLGISLQEAIEQWLLENANSQQLKNLRLWVQLFNSGTLYKGAPSVAIVVISEELQATGIAKKFLTYGVTATMVMFRFLTYEEFSQLWECDSVAIREHLNWIKAELRVRVANS